MVFFWISVSTIILLFKISNSASENEGNSTEMMCKLEKHHYPARGRYQRWCYHYVPYVIDSWDFDRDQRILIREVFKDWNQRIPEIQIKPYKNEKDYIHIYSGNGCWSYIGRIGGAQRISLQRNGCVYKETIQHEILHALGFIHEQSRIDRNEYVKILNRNIPDEWQSQYKIYSTFTHPNELDSYDYYSVMHYPVIAPGTDRKAMDILQDGIDKKRIGHGNDFTELDVKKLREYYTPNETWNCN